MWQRIVRLIKYWLWHKWRKASGVQAAIQQVITADEAARKKQEYLQAEKVLLAMRKHGELILSEDDIRAIMAQAYDETATLIPEKPEPKTPSVDPKSLLSNDENYDTTLFTNSYCRAYTNFSNIPNNTSSPNVVYVTDEQNFYIKDAAAQCEKFTQDVFKKLMT